MVELLLSDIIHNNDLIASEPSNHHGFVRSPLNYIGGKYKLLYHTHDRTRNATDEVFISNYQPVQQQLNLEF